MCCSTFTIYHLVTFKDSSNTNNAAAPETPETVHDSNVNDCFNKTFAATFQPEKICLPSSEHRLNQYALSLIVPNWDTLKPSSRLSMMQHLAINNVL